MGKGGKSKKSKTSAKLDNRDQYNLPLEDRSIASISMNEQEDGHELKFTNLKWSKVIKIGVTAANQISLSSIQEDWDEVKADPLPPRKP